MEFNELRGQDESRAGNAQHVRGDEIGNVHAVRLGQAKMDEIALAPQRRGTAMTGIIDEAVKSAGRQLVSGAQQDQAARGQPVTVQRPRSMNFTA